RATPRHRALHSFPTRRSSDLPRSNCVADAVLLEQSPTKGLVAVREFDPGEAWADYQRQIGVLKAMVAKGEVAPGETFHDIAQARDRKSTRLNSSHDQISYAVF